MSPSSRYGSAKYSVDYYWIVAVDGSIPARVVELQALHNNLDCWFFGTNQRSRPPGALASGPLASPLGVVIDFIDDYRVNQVWCVEPDGVRASHDRVALIPT